MNIFILQLFLKTFFDICEIWQISSYEKTQLTIIYIIFQLVLLLNLGKCTYIKKIFFKFLILTY